MCIDIINNEFKYSKCQIENILNILRLYGIN